MQVGLSPKGRQRLPPAGRREGEARATGCGAEKAGKIIPSLGRCEGKEAVHLPLGNKQVKVQATWGWCVVGRAWNATLRWVVEELER